MNDRILGRSGLRVSEVGFGCWAIGGTGYGPTRDEDSRAALETAWDRGINFYDTADTYGSGHSEELLGEFLKGKPRDRIVLASKAGWDFYHGGEKKNFDPAYLVFACEQSLKRLGVTSLDLCQLHNPGLDIIRQGDALGALETLQRAGKIRFIGVSVHREEEALACLDDSRVDCLQLIFNLLDQRMGKRVFDRARQRNRGIIVREPLANGLLTGKYGPGHEFAKTDHRRRWTKEKRECDFRKIELIRQRVKRQDVSLVRIALEYALGFEAVSTVIPGAKTLSQVRENILASEDPRLTQETRSDLSRLYESEEIFSKYLIPR